MGIVNWFKERSARPKSEVSVPVRVLVKNNSWVRYQPELDTVLVFVHGLLSDSDGCWRRNASFWPELVATDSTFEPANIFVGGYHTEISAGVYDIAQCSRELFAALKREESGFRSVLSHSAIVFVCHSLGGVICRRILEEFRTHFQGRLIGLVLMASPSLGSNYAKTFANIAKVYDLKVARELLPSSGSLLDIDNRFRQLLHDKVLDLVGCEAVEHRGPIWLRGFPGFTSPVVRGSSASRYFGAERMIPNTDHFSIVKPQSHHEESHRFLADFYREKIANRETPRRLAAPRVRSTQALALFEIYTPDCRPYYVLRDVDSQVSHSIRTRSVWLVGPSGSGKTSIARRLFDSLSVRPIEVSLAQVQNYGRDAVIEEIMQSMPSRRSGIGDMPGLADAVSSTESVVPLFIDEVPLADDGESIPKVIGDLLDAVKRRAGPDVHFVVCSIGSPNVGLLSERMREQVAMISVAKWVEPELQALLRVCEAGTNCVVPIDRVNDAISFCQGSPRFMKTLFRNLLVSTAATELERVSDALVRTRLDLRGIE